MDDLERYDQLRTIVDRDGAGAISSEDFEWLQNFHEDLEAAAEFYDTLVRREGQNGAG